MAMHIQLLLLLSSSSLTSFCLADPGEASAGTPADFEEVDSPTAEEYLGQYTYFRGWKTKRRLFIVKTNDSEVDRIEREAVYKYRCDLAIRNVNLVLCGDNLARETVFFHSEDNRRDFIQTRNLSRNLRIALDDLLSNLHRDLMNHEAWALLLDYDGGRKRLYKKVNFSALIDKIDSLPLRQREKDMQRDKMVECKSGL